MELQQQQLIHDKQYHNDILSLPTQDKTKHILLHLTKYLGKLVNNKEKEIILTDILICCLALGNALKNILSPKQILSPLDFEQFIYHYTTSLGKMAKSCEAMDHIENYPSNITLTTEVNNIFSFTMFYIRTIGLNPVELIKSRWIYIEGKDFLKDSRNKENLK